MLGELPRRRAARVGHQDRDRLSQHGGHLIDQAGSVGRDRQIGADVYRPPGNRLDGRGAGGGIAADRCDRRRLRSPAPVRRTGPALACPPAPAPRSPEIPRSTCLLLRMPCADPPVLGQAPATSASGIQQGSTAKPPTAHASPSAGDRRPGNPAIPSLAVRGVSTSRSRSVYRMCDAGRSEGARMTSGDTMAGRPDGEALIAAARALSPTVRDDAESAERARRLTPRVYAAIRDAGFLRILLPRRFGGYELDLETAINVILELSAACGSTGWVASCGISHQWMVAQFPAGLPGRDLGRRPGQAGRDLRSRRPAAARRVDGGFRIRWDLALCQRRRLCRCRPARRRAAPGKGWRRSDPRFRGRPDVGVRDRRGLGHDGARGDRQPRGGRRRRVRAGPSESAGGAVRLDRCARSGRLRNQSRAVSGLFARRPRPVGDGGRMSPGRAGPVRRAGGRLAGPRQRGRRGCQGGGFPRRPDAGRAGRDGPQGGESADVLPNRGHAARRHRSGRAAGSRRAVGEPGRPGLCRATRLAGARRLVGARPARAAFIAPNRSSAPGATRMPFPTTRSSIGTSTPRCTARRGSTSSLAARPIDRARLRGAACGSRIPAGRAWNRHCNRERTTMEIRAAVFRDNSLKPSSIETLEMSEPGAGEVLVKLTATGVCHTDLKTAVTDRSPRPVVLGHEGAGVVEAVGAGVTDLELGDHVVMSFTWCGDCPSCQSARPAYCYDTDHSSPAPVPTGATICTAPTARCTATSSISRPSPPMRWGAGGAWSRCARMRR